MVKHAYLIWNNLPTNSEVKWFIINSITLLLFLTLFNVLVKIELLIIYTLKILCNVW